MAPRASRSLAPVILMVFGAILLAGAVVMAAILSQSSGPDTRSAIPTEDTYPEIPRVGLAEAKEAYDNGTAVFVDVRDTGSFARGHIPGALSLPVNEISFRLNELAPEDWVVPY